MTVSRGAYVATASAAMLALYLFRRYVRPTKLAMAVASTLAVAVLAVAAAYMLGFGDLIERRMLGAAASTADLGGLSSGRTDIWASVMAVMFDHPLTMLTGFGWNAYAAMPLRWATHNHYLWAWFNLGLPGLICGVLLLVLPIKVALSASRVANAATRPHLIGLVVGMTALTMALFFMNLFAPWLYV